MRPPDAGAFSGETALADIILPHALPSAPGGREGLKLLSLGRFAPCCGATCMRLRNYLAVIDWRDRQAA